MSNPSIKLPALWSDFIPGPVEKIEHGWGSPQLYIKRLDLIRSWASGNKYYKLKHNIAEAIHHGVNTIVSKGGMFSNHLESLSEACMHFNIQCVCLIRAYSPDENNPSVRTLRSRNAEIIFLSPEKYNSYSEGDAHDLYPGSLFIPEGGSNAAGIRGTSEIYSELDLTEYNHLVVSGGTLSTAAGILSAAPASLNIIIVPAWKGCTGEYVDELLFKYRIAPRCTWELWPDHHFGGFGKCNHALAAFMFSFSEKTGIPLDPVYTGKMMFGIKEKMQEGYFSASDKILCIHTGGLQGIAGFQYRDPIMWNKYFELTQ